MHAWVSVLFLHAGEGFYAALNENLHKRNGTGRGYTDIYDGTVYQRLVSEGFFSQPSHISLMFNTDGLPVFRSSGFSFWPLYLFVNELPYRMR